MPVFDEYLLCYKNHTTSFAPEYDKKFNLVYGLFNLSILIGHKWRCKVQKHKIVMMIRPFVPLDKVQDGALDEAMVHYSRFVGQTVKFRLVFDH